MIFIEEIWKPIEGYENYYISNLGNVKNIKGKLLCLWKDNVGYLQVVLRKNKKKKHKNKDEDVQSFVDDRGKIKSTDDLDKYIMKNMSRCAGYSYFRNESNEY